jgi:hypothetical protein
MMRRRAAAYHGAGYPAKRGKQQHGYQSLFHDDDVLKD